MDARSGACPPFLCPASLPSVDPQCQRDYNSMTRYGSGRGRYRVEFASPRGSSAEGEASRHEANELSESKEDFMRSLPFSSSLPDLETRAAGPRTQSTRSQSSLPSVLFAGSLRRRNRASRSSASSKDFLVSSIMREVKRDGTNKVDGAKSGAESRMLLWQDLHLGLQSPEIQSHAQTERRRA